MAMGIYVGAGGVKTVNAIRVGAGGVKTVNAVYVGAGGVKQVWPSIYELREISTSNWGGIRFYRGTSATQYTTLTPTYGSYNGVYSLSLSYDISSSNYELMLYTLDQIDFSPISYLAVDISANYSASRSYSNPYAYASVYTNIYTRPSDDDGHISIAWPGRSTSGNPNGNDSIYYLIDCTSVNRTGYFKMSIYFYYLSSGSSSYTIEFHLYSVLVGGSTNASDYGGAFATYGFNYTRTMT